MAGNTIQITIVVKNQGSKEIGDTTKKLSGLAKAGKIAGTALTGLGTSLVRGIVAFGASAVKEGMAFTKAMSNVKAITGATESQFTSLTKVAQDLGSQTKFTGVEVAEGMAFMSMAGFEVNEVISAMPGVLNLAAAGNLELGKSADIVSNILTGFGEDATETGRFVDVLAKTFTSSNTDLIQLGGAMKNVAPVAANLGLSVEQTAAALGVFGDGGIQAGAAGTQLKTILLSLAAPVGQAKDLIKELGIEVFDAQGQMLPFPEIIGNYADAVKDLTPEQQLMAEKTIIGKRAIAGFDLLLKEGEEGLTSFGEELLASSEDFNGLGTAAGIAGEQLNNLEGDTTLLNSAISGFKITAFELMEPTLRGATQALTVFVGNLTKGANAWQWMSEAKQAMEEAGGAAGAFAGGIQGVINVLVPVAGVVDTLSEAIGLASAETDILFQANQGFALSATEVATRSEAQARAMGLVTQESSATTVALENLLSATSDLAEIETDATQQSVELSRNRSFLVTESDKLAMVTAQIARETEAYQQSQEDAAAAEEARKQTTISLLGVMGTFFTGTREAQEKALESERSFSASITNLRESAAESQLSAKEAADEKILSLEEQRAAEEHRILTGGMSRSAEATEAFVQANNAKFQELKDAEITSLNERQAAISADLTTRENQASEARAKEVAAQQAHLEELKLNAALATLESTGQLAQFTDGLAISASEAAGLIKSGVLPVTAELGAAIQGTLGDLQATEGEVTAQLASNQAILQEAFAGTLTPIEAQALALGTGIPEAAAVAQAATGLANADIIAGAQSAAIASEEQNLALQNLGTTTFPTLGEAASVATQTMNEAFATIATPIGQIDTTLTNIGTVTLPALVASLLENAPLINEQFLLILDTGIIPINTTLVTITTVTLPNLQAMVITVAATSVTALTPVLAIITEIDILIIQLTASTAAWGAATTKAGEEAAKGFEKAAEGLRSELIPAMREALSVAEELASALSSVVSAASNAGSASKSVTGTGFKQGLGFAAGTPSNTGGALGLGFKIPGGFNNDSFGPMFAQSGEEMLITPRGLSIEELVFGRLGNLIGRESNQSKTNITNTTNNATLVVNTSARSEPIISDMKVLQSMLGT